jgi:hypothetical protein
MLKILVLALLAALTDPMLIPDGDYVVVVEKIVDAKHMIVKMDNGIESEIAATATVSFDPSSHIKRAKIFVYKGLIITFKPA